MDDRHRLKWSIGLAVLGAALGVGYCVVVYGWVHGHSDMWGFPTDSSMLTQSGALLLHGHPESVYSSNPGLYALPLSFPLTGLAALIVNWTRLPTDPHPEWIFVVVPFFCALAVPALYQVRALAWDLGVRRRLLVVQVLTAALIIPPLVEWGHPEDVLAIAFVLSATQWLVKGDPVRACLHLSIAVSFKQWAVILVPLAVLATPRGQRHRGILAATTLPVGLALAFFAADPHHALHAFTSPSTDVVGFPGHPSIAGAWLGGRTSQFTRFAITMIAWGITFAKRRSTNPTTIATTAATILMVRPILETANYSYYWAPALVLAAVATAERRGRLLVADCVWPVLALAWTLPRSNDLTSLDWWAGEGLLLAIVAYRLHQAARNAAKTDPVLPYELLRRAQPVHAAG